MLDALNNLPLEVLMEICSNLTNEDIGAFGSTDKVFLAKARADSLWETKFKINFPDVYLKLKNRYPHVPEKGWYAAFVRTYEEQYKTLISKKTRALLSRVKEGKDFTDLNVTHYEVFKTDINGKCAVDWAREKNNQTALDAFFNDQKIRVALAVNPVKKEWTFPNESTSHVSILGLLSWGVLFRQSETFIETWLKRGAAYDDCIVYILALDGNLAALELFIEHTKHKKGVNLIASQKRLLSAAAANGHLNIVNYLLDRGVKPDTRQDEGENQTPLYLAAAYGHIKVAERLLEAKADVFFADMSGGFGQRTGMKPIHVAAQNGHLEIIKLFWEHKHKKELIYIESAGYKKPIHFAAEQGHLKIVKFFLEQDKNLINTQSQKGETPLLLAASGGHMGTVIYLLEQGAELCDINAWGHQNAFFLAAVNGHLEMVKFLAKKDPTLQKNCDLQEILVSAARKGHVEIVKYLLSEGVQPATGLQVDPLIMAVENGHLEVVRVLDAHSPINNNINRLLLSALIKKQDAMVTVLLEHYFAQVASTEMLVDKLKNLEKEHYQIALSHCKLFKKDLITQSSLLILLFQELPTEKFKVFFTSVVQLGIFSIDEVVIAANSKNMTGKEYSQENQNFIVNKVAPFTPYRKEIEALIAKLNTKSQELKEQTSRSQAIANLAAIFQKEVNQFFTQPSHINSTNLFFHCEAAVKDDCNASVNSSQTGFEWRIINKILLIVAHIFVITIPFIWLYPASRNALLGKTDSQVKAEDALESIRQFNQLVIGKKFDRFFHPVKPEISNSETPITEPKILSNATGIQKLS